MAALPRPAPGTESIRPTSPQHICSMEITLARFAPFLISLPPSAARPGTLAARPPAALRRSSTCSSTGTSCSCLSYLREMGRMTFSATARISCDTPSSFSGSSQLIMSPPPLNRDAAFENAHRPQVAVPELDHVLADEAVATEQLHAVGADLHALVGRLQPRQVRLALERQALLGARCRAVRQEAQAVELDGDVGDHERDRLAVRDRLAEGHAVVAISDHVVEHGLRHAGGQRCAADAAQVDQALQVE